MNQLSEKQEACSQTLLHCCNQQFLLVLDAAERSRTTALTRLLQCGRHQQ